MKYGYNNYYELLDRCTDGDLRGAVAGELLQFWNFYHRYMKRKTHGVNDEKALQILKEMVEELENHILETKER